MRFALGTDHDLRDVPPPLPARPADRPRDQAAALAAAAPAAGAVRGARLGRLRAADRVARAPPRSSAGSCAGWAVAAPAARCVAAPGRAPGRLRAGRAGRLRAGAASARSRWSRAAREVASGRADLSRHEPSWRRLLKIPNIGSWTIEMLAFEGQGRDDMLPALDLAYVKLVGRLAGLGRRATEDEVRDVLRPLRGARRAGRDLRSAPSLRLRHGREAGQDRAGVARGAERRPLPRPAREGHRAAVHRRLHATPRRTASTAAAPAATSCSARTRSSTRAPAGRASPSRRSPTRSSCTRTTATG